MSMQLTPGRRRVVIGDIHGELDGFREMLSHAGLMDAEGNWSGGDATMVQTGDVIDRGPHSRETVEFLRALQKQAALSKGVVVRLCGNHELMLLQGNFHYANFDDPESLVHELREEIARGDVRASYTDGDWLYTHAGLRSAIRKALTDEIRAEEPELQGGKIDLATLSNHINKVFRNSVEKDGLDRHPIFHVGIDRGGDHRVGGIFWCDYASINPSVEAWHVAQIFGHTPTRENGVKSAHGLKLIDVDAGICRVYGGKRVYLEITPKGSLMEHSKVDSEWQRRMLAMAPGEHDMTRLKETFQSAIGISLEPLLPADELTPFYHSEHGCLLFGSRIALKQGPCLAQTQIDSFVKSAREGYFMIGFWGHGINSHAFYYVKSEPNWEVYFRLPYGGVYMDNVKYAAFIREFMTAYLDFESKHKEKIVSFVAVNSMGAIHYRMIDSDGRRYLVDDKLIGASYEADLSFIFDFPVIRLPDNPVCVERLRVNLEEFKQVLADIDCGNSSEEGALVQEATYKIRILETLLLKGEVCTSRLWAKIGYERHGRDRTIYTKACAVIHDYCRRDGAGEITGETAL
jgi:hypothetical protein